ncbi:ACT domain-containing protein DS12, chloroplastic-like isoform X2 [Zingiber officinale]|uniref:ACT domain-containing protein DS12, chloroplastic-like isoform X2 n=1 Tax=Zingiber officinale TaxID=94328 RepID=UPI001C4AB42F|nr:ACT domain-containing protein DS12, chloroplastic-like isoform X2 [Zingiber officinale]
MAVLAMASGVLRPSLGLNLEPGGAGLWPTLLSHSLRRSRSAISTPSKIRCPSQRTPRATYSTAVEDDSSKETDRIPTPKVIIDQDSNPDATIVEVAFGDRLGALLDTMNSLRNLGLHVVKADEYLESTGKHHRFMVTNRSLAVNWPWEQPLEWRHLSRRFSSSFVFQIDVDVATHIDIYDDGPDRSLLVVETADRPGLLVDLVQSINDINITVQSGEFGTEGLLAKAKFHVSYRNRAIINSLQQVLSNSLSYSLRRPSTEDASF